MTFTNEEVERIVKENNGLHKAIQKYKTQNKLLRHFVLGPITRTLTILREKRRVHFERLQRMDAPENFEYYKKSIQNIDEDISMFNKLLSDAETIFNEVK